MVAFNLKHYPAIGILVYRKGAVPMYARDIWISMYPCIAIDTIYRILCTIGKFIVKELNVELRN